ncbi:MAG: M14 family metallopeptidase [Thermoguttaceae bacterium]|jgi:hypothetical protein|nr:M14 family metallopeptidase [Thermoguttaceae bacterium]
MMPCLAGYGRQLTVIFASLTTLSSAAMADRKAAVEGYASFETLRVQLEQVARSPLAKLTTLGRTREGREVFLLTIGKGKVDDRPGILVIGGLDAAQLFGSELAVRAARQLVEQAESDRDTARLVERVTFYVIPRASPDACEFFFIRPFEERTTNTRPTDVDNDGRVDEDPPGDINGDGWITAMRVEEPGGRYMEHPDDPRVMILADPQKGERGRWSVHVEGVDDDGDGQFSEDPIGGVAFDRNFTFRYPYFASDAGPFQVGEPETQAVADFAFERRNIAVVFTFTAQDNLFHVPKGEPSEKQGKIKTKLLAADAPHLERMATLYRELHGGSDAPQSPEGNGSVSDWAYFHYGRWSLAARAWWIPPTDPAEPESDKVEEPPTDKDADADADDESAESETDSETPAEPAKDEPATAKKPSDEQRGRDELRALAWFDREGIDGFVPWQPIEHPDFPDRRVEVGGFKPYRRTNPPLAELDGLDGKHVEFLCRIAGMVPKLRIAESKAESLGGGVWRVSATVANDGELPTFPQMGEISRQTQPVQIAIDLPDGASLVTGHPRRRLPTLAGHGGHATEAWLVRLSPQTKPKVRVRAWAPAVGQVRKSVPLKEP